jgi:hypothetical protein
MLIDAVHMMCHTLRYVTHHSVSRQKPRQMHRQTFHRPYQAQ